jgi:CheY-like chemotaxis protein
VDGGLAAFFRDITEQKQLEQNLRETDRRKDEFLAMLAHELRNPLAPISAAVEIMRMVQFDEARLKQTSQVISRQVSHMTGLVDDLLDVSRVTRGLIELNNDALDIQHVVNEAVEQACPLIRSRGQVLTISLAPQKASVYGDKKRLVQVLANILNNAAKYTAEGGHLTLCTSVQDKKVLIEVTDDGIGMTLETAKHAFDLFAQAERSSDRASGGLGLGLALVKSLVELHDGTVSCKSGGLGRGSTFSICLPRLVQQIQPASSAAGEVVAASTNAPLKVMVVDDNVDAAEMLKMLLEMMGHEVTVEHGPLRALQQAKFYKPQVCLVDIGLPEIDGNELARRLRAQPENAEAVLVAVTGYGQESDRASTLAAGFDHHLVKPIDVVALSSILGAMSRK